MIDSFWNPDTGVFFDTDGSDKTVLHRRSSPWDGAIPSPNAIALECLSVLYVFTHKDEWKEIADAGYAAVLGIIDRGPRGFSGTLRSLWMAVAEPSVAVVIGTGDSSSLDEWKTAFGQFANAEVLPVFSLNAKTKSDLEIFTARNAREAAATLYLCKGATCLPPSNQPSELARLLKLKIQ